MENLSDLACCTVFNSPEVYRKKHQNLFKLLESDIFVNGIPFYDFNNTNIDDYNGTFKNVSKSKTQKENTYNFVEALTPFFLNYRTGKMGSPSEIELSIEAIICKAYEKYASNIDEFIPNIDDACRKDLLTQWVDVTSVVIWDCLFCHGYICLDRSGTFHSTLPLCKSASFTLRGIKDDLLFDTPVSEDGYEIVYYNFWRDSYINDMLDLHQQSFEKQLSEECRCKIKVWENKTLFRNYFDDMVPKTISLTTMFDSELAMKFLEALFLDFAQRLRMFGITHATEMIPAINGWVTFTVEELRSILLRDKINVVFSFWYNDLIAFFDISKKQVDGSCPIKDFRNLEIPLIDYQYLRKEEDFIDACISKIHGCANVYIEQLQKGHHFYPWTDSLNALNINYSYLYKRMLSINRADMKSVSINTDTDSKAETVFHILNNNVPYSLFKNCFYEADFSVIMDSANKLAKIYTKKSGGPGCVKLLIIEVANRLDDKQWKYKAAESVEHRVDGRKSYDSLVKTHVSEVGHKFQKEVLNYCFPKYEAK